MKSIIRWAGGKSRVIDQVLNEFPKFSGKYYEPFMGSATIYLGSSIQKAVLADTNKELINCFEQVKNNHNNVWKEFVKFENTKESYSQIRSMDRKENFNSIPLEVRAARFLYLNKTCFQGLWRVNSRGENNVPYGKLKTIACHEQNLLEFSNRVQNAEFKSDDFEVLLKNSGKDDFVYMDPPYIKISETSSFVAYVSSGFPLEEHLRVKKVCDDLNSKGVKFLLSNSDCNETRDLYRNYWIKEITTRRSISAKKENRGEIKELLIKNY